MFNFALQFEEAMEFNEKQIQILEAAERLFSEHGFKGASVRLIAKEADVNIAMISYYFGSKEKLLEDLLLYKLSDFKMKLANVIDDEKIDLNEKIDKIISLIVKRIHRNRRMYKIVHFEFSNNTRNIDFSHYIAQKKENYAAFARFVQEGQQAGIFSKKVNTSLLVPTILGTYFHFQYNKNFFVDTQNLKTEADVDNYVVSDLIPHIQQTLKALLNYEQ